MDMRDIPGIRSLLELRYRRRFQRPAGAGCWYGDYPTLDVAIAAAPAGAPVGYDVDGPELFYEELNHKILLNDYPAVFWLEKWLRPNGSVLDLGGHVGIKYRAFRSVLTHGQTVRWTVCDVPRVVEEGRRRAQREGATKLDFTSDFAALGRCDILLASGSLQYLPQRLGDLLAEAEQRPPYVIVNLLPTLPTGETITLQNIGVTYCPYRIESADALPAALVRLGYERVDTWQQEEGRREVPFNRRARVVTWVGHAFRRQADHDGDAGRLSPARGVSPRAS